MADYVDEAHQRIAEFAEDFLDEDEREGFTDALMERNGYVRQSSWGPPEQPGGRGGRAPVLPSGAKRRNSQGGGGQGGGQGGGGGRRSPYFKQGR